jgi:hypothetical protein
VTPVATTYSTNARLQKPATSDRNWDVSINANTDAIDGFTAIGGLAVTTTESPSAALQVGVSPGNFVKSNGTLVNYPGVPAFVVPASSTAYLWLTDAGVLTSGPSFPASAHLRLAHVVAGPTSVLQVVDERVQCSVAGAGLGFVLKAGDTISGPLTIVSPGSGTPLVAADPVNWRIGFFGASPASQAPVLNPLSIPSGVASDALADVGPSFSQAVLNNNFASLATKVDALIAALKRHGLMGS